MKTSVEKAHSADGTSIALEVTGNGSAVVLIGGAFNDRTTTAGLAQVLARLAHSLPYDCALFEPGWPVPDGRLARVKVPTLVIAGSNTFPWLAAAAEQVAHAVPGARFLSLEGQDHGVLQQPAALLACLREFLG